MRVETEGVAAATDAGKRGINKAPRASRRFIGAILLLLPRHGPETSVQIVSSGPRVPCSQILARPHRGDESKSWLQGVSVGALDRSSRCALAASATGWDGSTRQVANAGV